MITYPVYKGKSLFVRDLGALPKDKPPALQSCEHVDLGFLPEEHFWIYSISCDGKPVLSLSDMQRYVEAQQQRINRSWWQRWPFATPHAVL